MKHKTLQSLIDWYEKNKRPLPWRSESLRQPYFVWIAEIMSQQTQMNALLPYFYRFIEKFPSVKSLAEASLESVYEAWTGLGYYSRARNVHALAKEITFSRGGIFPATYQDWLALPGVGPYTAAAVCSQCFGEKVPVWDGNVLRVLSRVFKEKGIYLKPTQDQMKARLQDWISNYSASSFNQAWMELGALVCVPKNPKCPSCPIQAQCESFLTHTVSLFPPPKPRKKEIDVQAKVWLIFDCSKKNVLVEKRIQGQWFSGMWDFPSELGGVKQPVSTREFLFLKNKNAKILPEKTKHAITHHKISLQTHQTYLDSAEKLPVELKWVSIDDLIENKTGLPIATTTRKILKNHLKQRNVDSTMEMFQTEE